MNRLIKKRDHDIIWHVLKGEDHRLVASRFYITPERVRKIMKRDAWEWFAAHSRLLRERENGGN